MVRLYRWEQAGETCFIDCTAGMDVVWVQKGRLGRMLFILLEASLQGGTLPLPTTPPPSSPNPIHPISPPTSLGAASYFRLVPWPSLSPTSLAQDWLLRASFSPGVLYTFPLTSYCFLFVFHTSQRHLCVTPYPGTNHLGVLGLVELWIKAMGYVGKGDSRMGEAAFWPQP